MKLPELSKGDLSDLKPHGFDDRTPLWFYILREAQVTQKGKQTCPRAEISCASSVTANIVSELIPEHFADRIVEVTVHRRARARGIARRDRLGHPAVQRTRFVPPFVRGPSGPSPRGRAPPPLPQPGAQ